MRMQLVLLYDQNHCYTKINEMQSMGVIFP